MRHVLRIGFAILLMFMLVAAASAETYTLDKCIETALQNNYYVIDAKNKYDASRWWERAAWGNILPSMSISASRSERWSQSVDPFSGAFSTYTEYYTGSMSFRQSFAGLGIGTIASIRLQQAQKNSRYYEYVDTKDALILTVKEAYFNIIKTKMLVDVSKDAVKRGEEQLKVAQSRYELGSASLSDVLKAKVSRSNAKLELITAENSYDLAKANLSFAMGSDVTEEIEITEEFPESELDITYNLALNEALANNPLYVKARYDLTSAKADRWVKRTAFLPSLDFSLTHYSNAQDANDLITFDNYNTGYSYGLALSFNIFNGLADYANLYSAGKSVNTSRENLENTKNSVGLEVKQAFLDVQQNIEKLNLNEESVAAAQEDLNIVREKYNLGAATIIEVLDAEVLFKQAQVNQVQAQFDYHLAISRLEKVMGR